MPITRSRRFTIIVVGSLIASLTVVTVAAELGVRSRIDAVVGSLAADLPGIDASSASGLALWSLVTKRASIDVSLDDAALERIISCRTGREVSVSTTDAGIAVETDLELRGASVAVRTNLLPRKDGGTWTLVPDAVNIGNFSLPPEQVAGLLGDRAPDWLNTGIVLPSTDDLSVTRVALGDGKARLTVSTSVSTRTSDRDDPFADLACA